MRELINTIEPTMTSFEIAKLTGKRHADVLRDIRELNQSYKKLSLCKIAFKLKNKDLGFGRVGKTPYCKLTKMQTFDLLTGYSRELRIIVNRRWAELEEKTTLHIPPPKIINGVPCIHYVGWVLQGGYSVMSGNVGRRRRKYPNQFIKTKDGWYMSVGIADHFTNTRSPAQRAKALPSLHPNQLKFDY